MKTKVVKRENSEIYNEVLDGPEFFVQSTEEGKPTRVCMCYREDIAQAIAAAINEGRLQLPQAG